jgi:2-polyprenyl-3-methyl-5-hydroxy-6-metoxy-1,4-benzoquinol methylase
MTHLDHAHLTDDTPAPHGSSDLHTDTPSWDGLYAGKPEWDIDRPQPAFQALAEAGAFGGRVLDVGCGTGEHVLLCARLGLDATGVDVSSAAIRIAEQKARDRGLAARFLLQDARRLADLGESFDTVLDCGLFVHVVDDDADRVTYLDGLRSVVPPGGRYFMACFRGEQGHHRALTHDEIAAAFADGWRVDSIDPTMLKGVANADGIPAWLVTVTRT